MDELRDQVGALVVDRRLVQRDDSGVREPGRRPGLALEASADDPLAGENLDRHLAVESLVARQPYGGESAGAEPPPQAIATEHDRGVRLRAAVLDARRAAAGNASWVRGRRTVGASESCLVRSRTGRFSRRWLGPLRAGTVQNRLTAVAAGHTDRSPFPPRSSVSFFDEPEETRTAPRAAPRRRRPTGGPRRPRSVTSQAILVRRIVLAVVVVVVAIVLIAVARQQLRGERTQQRAEGLQQQRRGDQRPVQQHQSVVLRLRCPVPRATPHRSRTASTRSPIRRAPSSRRPRASTSPTRSRAPRATS